VEKTPSPIRKWAEWIAGITALLTALVALLSAIGSLPDTLHETCEKWGVCGSARTGVIATSPTPSPMPSPPPNPPPNITSNLPTNVWPPENGGSVRKSRNGYEIVGTARMDLRTNPNSSQVGYYVTTGQCMDMTESYYGKLPQVVEVSCGGGAFECKQSRCYWPKEDKTIAP
jgi:hypothetical protein